MRFMEPEPKKCPVCDGISHRRGEIEKMICGAIRNTIKDHGPITHDTASSAAKRVIGALKGYYKNDA